MTAWLNYPLFPKSPERVRNPLRRGRQELFSVLRSNVVGRSTLRRPAAVVVFCVGMVACSATEPHRPSTWTALAAHVWYTCGLSVDGGAFCWGGTPGGFRGDPPLQDSLIPNSAVPLRVPGGRRFTQITVGETVMCALDSLRTAYCWGPNDRGELGDGSFLDKRGPSAVIGGHQWKLIDAGMSHVCGITLDGQTYCWGNNFRGALGLGDGTLGGASPQPLEVSGRIAFVTIAAGSGTSCGLTADGAAYCWGINDNGMLGDGQQPRLGSETDHPVPVAGNLRFLSIAVGAYNVCGVTPEGHAYCWGYGGVLGDGTVNASSSPVPVAGDLRWQSLSVGSGHTCGLTREGAAYCWGNGERGRFGNGDTTIVLMPRLIADAGKYARIVAGGRHTCAITPLSTALCWGYGEYGQLGHGFMRDELRPVQVASYR